jgi:ParB-like chromosome segregation protein Spo0J
VRNRIKAHRKVRVGDLVPHEQNPRLHSEAQRQALRALIGEIGFARSVLAYELPDGRLKLIDGHLRQSELDPDDEIDVEVLDVTDDEARKLLLAIDPLAQLADYDAAVLAGLRETVEGDSEAVAGL